MANQIHTDVKPSHTMISLIRIHTYTHTHKPVSKRGDDQPGCVAQVLIGVPELRVAYVGKAVLQLLIPAVPQLAQPGEGLGEKGRGGGSRIILWEGILSYL